MIFKWAKPKWAHFKSLDFNFATNWVQKAFYIQLQEYSRYFILEKKKNLG